MILDFLQAQALVLDRASSIAPVRLPIDQVAGLVLADDLIAGANVPPFDRSPYDGYALRAEDIASASQEGPVTLQIVEEVPAGDLAKGALESGQAIKILTGAPIPVGADCVVKFEDTDFTPDQVTFFAPVKAGSNIIRAGEDVLEGQLLAQKGTRIDSGLLGTLAAQGQSHPLVYPKPKVAMIASGNELVDVGEALPQGKIYNSNRYLIGAALERAGFEVLDLGIAEDRPEGIRAAIEKGLALAHAVIVTGGVSVGDYDHTPQAIMEAGVGPVVRNVDLKPGGYCVYGFKEGKLVCGLSGNPVSGYTNFNLIALPALKKMAGLAKPEPDWIPMILSEDFNKRSPKGRVIQGKMDLTDGRVRLRVMGAQGNAIISGMIGTDAMAVIPKGSGPLPAGSLLKGFRI